MTPITAFIILWLNGMLCTLSIILVAEVEFGIRGIIKPGQYLYLCLLWPYFIWLIVKEIFSDD